MRYRELRWPCDFPVSVVHGDTRLQARIVNVSAGGARLRVENAPEPGQVVSLEFGNNRLAATVRWARAGMCGVRLLTPLNKPELSMIRRGHPNATSLVSGRWNAHLHEMR